MGSNRIKKFLKDETGANAVEYALIAGLLSVAVVFAVTVLGDSVKTSYQSLCNVVVFYAKFGSC